MNSACDTFLACYLFEAASLDKMGGIDMFWEVGFGIASPLYAPAIICDEMKESSYADKMEWLCIR